LNSASSESEIRDLLSSPTRTTLTTTSLNVTNFYNDVLDNLNTDFYNTYTSFETLFNELITYELALVSSLVYANTTLTENNPLDYSILLTNIINAVSGSSIQVVDDGVNGLETASALAVRLTNLESNLKTIEEEIWLRQDLIDNRTYGDFATLENRLNAIYQSLQSLTVYDATQLVVSPSAFIIVTGTALSDIQSYLNSDALYPRYDDSETLILVDNWDYLEGDWETAKNTEGTFTFVATFRFDDSSQNLFDIDRNVTTLAISVTVSTISYLENLEEVSFSKNASEIGSTLTLSFNVDDQNPDLILGSDIDSIDRENGMAEFRLKALTSA